MFHLLFYTILCSFNFFTMGIIILYLNRISFCSEKKNHTDHCEIFQKFLKYKEKITLNFTTSGLRMLTIW